MSELFVVRVVSCTNEIFINADGDPRGLYVGNVRPSSGYGFSWLPMSLTAAEMCSTLEDASRLMDQAMSASRGFVFEVVRLTEVPL